MTGQEIMSRLRQRPFEPFRITMDNGQVPSDDDETHVVGPAVTCELRNISTLEPLPRQSA